MAVVIINPNSTASMTTAMVDAARIAAPNLSFTGLTSEKGPPAIQGPEDGEAAKPHFLELVEHASSSGSDAIIIGCFDDTALEEAAEIANCPVVGLGQSSYHYAALRNWRFSVVTTLSVSVPIIENNIRNLGLGRYLSNVRASNVPVLDLETNPIEASQIVKEEALRAQESDGVSAVVLGCAGMVQVLEEVQNTLDIETIDPVACAARSLNWLI